MRGIPGMRRLWQTLRALSKIPARPAMSTDLEEMARFEQLAEKAYDEMYETRYPTGLYSELKEYFALAIAAAERAGRGDEAERLRQRRDHCKAVYRSQFSQF